MNTTLTSWAQLIWETLRDNGIDSRACFTQAGLDPALLSNPNARYPVSGMITLWQTGQSLYQHQDFGLAVGQRWHPTTFNALGYAWLASDTLQQALLRLERYARLISNGLEVKLTPKGAVYELDILIHGNAHPAASLAGIAALVSMCRLLLGPSFSPVSVSLADVDLSAEARAYLGCHLERRGRCTVALDRQQAHVHLPGANAELALLNEKLALEHLGKLDNVSITDRARRVMVNQLPGGQVCEASVALALAMSPRSLQRHLQREQGSFKQLLGSVRRELAQLHLATCDKSLGEISYLLGYADQPSFNRAFKRWFGVSPGQFQQRSAQAQSGATVIKTA
ncbi:AraC family transcriptional regulator [Gilvimarinus algae]|uniref:AraC family transcriptional regulator ligand-binding domain-containing protein n=1 Tax=Gilvimarinus algae TaxID=3058037 RepID=A0ABT8TAS7_9GAMM|nr:AraC family transcriptional regulator [Gilvimarinus sp. SDUM040014]MDO3381217.1 AraC family transcriptional regulator ligand-binding domain-containing protein [Gilvimarinus sp. SDUM040014]